MHRFVHDYSTKEPGVDRGWKRTGGWKEERKKGLGEEEEEERGKENKGVCVFYSLFVFLTRAQ